MCPDQIFGRGCVPIEALRQQGNLVLKNLSWFYGVSYFYQVAFGNCLKKRKI
jgi:hypothetical protein